MRLFFHLVRGREIIRDESGIEVADLQEAQTEALRAIEEMRREHPSASQDWVGWRLDVTDAAGAVILSIDLGGRHH
jgi:hypothetical protein